MKILEITIGQGDDYATGCLLDYPYFKKYYKMVAIPKQFNKLILQQISIEK